jgi:hypothetical protein
MTIRDCFSAVRELRSVWALALGILAALAGVGTTGDLTGTTTMFYLTTTILSPTVERFLTMTHSIAAEAASIIAGRISGMARLGSIAQARAFMPALGAYQHFMDRPLQVASPVCTPAPSAALIMAAP